MSLKQSAIIGVKWASLSSIVIAVLQILQISVLTRYLSADDFGLMAIVMIVIGFSRIFSDMGISNAIIHHQNSTHAQLSSLYWLNIAIGTLLFIIIVLISPYISSFYNEPMLRELLVWLSLTFILSSIGNQYRILLQKKLQFNTMAKIEISSALASFFVAVYLAVMHHGIYALVFGTLSNTVISTILYLFIGLREHRPSLIFSYISIKPYLRFGMYQMGQSTLNYFNSQFDVILIGKLLGTETLGIYSIVKQLAMRPAQIINPIITKVTFPILAKVQDNKGSLKNIYLKTINYISLINFPIYMLISILAEPIVFVLLGEEWKEAVPILQILSIYFMIRSIGNPIGSLVMATGQVHLEFWWNVSMLVIFPISIYFGSFWGLKGVSYSLIILMLSTIVPMWFYIIKPITNVTLSEYLSIFMKPILFSFVSFSFLLILLFPIDTILMIFLYVILTLIIYVYLNYKFGINILAILKYRQ